MTNARRIRTPSTHRRLRGLTPLMMLTASALTSTASLAQSPGAADLVLKNGTIYTVDQTHRTVEALAVKAGKIVFAGTNTEAAPFVGPNTTVVDAGGKLVLPGLIDAHIHPGGIVDFGGCNLEAKPHTLAEIGTIVGGCIERMKIPPGKWVAVSQWEYAAGNEADPKHPTLRAALDAASTKHPIVMTGWDGHHGAYNSAALALARNAAGKVVGYSKQTLATDFAKYQALVGVDSHGEPSGDLQDDSKSPIDASEVARDYFNKLFADPQRLAQRINSVGLTAIQDAATSESNYQIYDALISKGQLTFRLNMAQFLKPDNFRNAEGRVDWDKMLAQLDTVRRKYATNPLARADVIKTFADGDMEANPNNIPPTFGASPRPVPYLQPIFEKGADGVLYVKGYVDPGSPECVYVRARPTEYSTPTQIKDFMATYGYHPGQCAISYGTTSYAPAAFFEYVKRAHLAGYTIHIHVISDLAARMAIDALEAARKADGVTSRPDTLAHLQCATPEDVLRIGKNHFHVAFTYSWMYAEPKGYSLSTVPFFDKVSGNSYESLHNPNNYFEHCTYPAKSTLDAGAVVSAGSDAPVLTRDPQPFVNMEIGVTRARHGLPPLSPWERLTVREVIDAYTINGAKTLGREAEIGSLEVGKSADFIIVDQDILKLAIIGQPEKIGDTKVLETWFIGKKVWARSN